MKDIRRKLNELYNREEKEKNNRGYENISVHEELKRLFYSRIPIKHFPKSQIEKDNLPLEEMVNGRWINTHFGDIFRSEFIYDVSEPYGALDLREIYQFDSSDYVNYFQIPNIDYPDNIIFIDTETTGLIGGSGTVAFMVGLGWLKNQKFTIHQYFITQLSHEEGMLELLQSEFRNFSCILSFNGKSFDIPLLNTRFVMNRLSPVLQNYPHIDLLHISRSLWKYSIENCKLKTLEIDLLGIERQDDIPGELIPDVYFDYLRSRNLEKIERIFYHNRFDVISMLACLILIFKTLKSKVPEKNPLTDYAKGRLYSRKKDIERSICHYKNVLESSISCNRRLKTLLELAQLYKKNKQYEEAVPLWEKVLDPQFPFSLEPYIELAKYYEHIKKDLQKALDFTDSAYYIIPGYREKEITELIKRRERINKKKVPSRLEWVNII